MSRAKINRAIRRLISSIWLFPSVLGLALITLTALQINGSSIGIYHDIFYGQTTNDDTIIQGNPREIRSDEWLVTTQLTIAQHEAGFPRINPNFNGGQDMSILSDVPYLEWSALFKPQNFSFFFLPLEHAFAFKWWFLIFLLALSAYFLCLRLLPNKIGFAISVAVIASCSPFVFWWYQSGTILTLAYGILAVLLSINLIDRHPLRIPGVDISTRTALVLQVLLLAYILVAFALLLYPPFQIPVLLAGSFFIIGHLLQTTRNRNWKTLLAALAPHLLAAVVAATLCLAFIATRSDAIHAISNTAYPGERVIPAGGYDVTHLFTTYLQAELIDNNKQNQYYSNQSETSSFILLPIFFILPLAYLAASSYRSKHQHEWPAYALLFANLILLCHLLLPGSDILSRLFFLHTVPAGRAVVGLGFIALLSIIYIAKMAKEITFSKKTTFLLAGYVLIFFCICIYYGLVTRELYPTFAVSRKIIVLYAFVVVFGMTLVLIKRPLAGGLVLALFSAYSTYQVHPLQIGLGPLYGSSLVSSVKNISSPNDTWAVADDMRFENVPQLSNRKAISGVALYPNVDFWDDISDKPEIYNRYAHVVFDKNIKDPLLLVQTDVFVATIQCDSRLTHRVDFVLTTSELTGDCYKLVKTVHYPRMTFYIYSIDLTK